MHKIKKKLFWKQTLWTLIRLLVRATESLRMVTELWNVQEQLLSYEIIRTLTEKNMECKRMIMAGQCHAIIQPFFS